MVPALVARAKLLPDSFRSGLGQPYDDPDISEGIDRFHAVKFRTVFVPHVVPAVLGGALDERMRRGCRVADLGCGSGALLCALARAYPRCELHGFEISTAAVTVGRGRVKDAGLAGCVTLHGPDELMGAAGQFDAVFSYDVLHDAPQPRELMRIVRAALPEHGVWVVADINGLDGVEANVRDNPMAALCYGFSIPLCMSSALSEPGGEGLGTLGFSIPVARRMFAEEGFTKVKVLDVEEARKGLERYFEVQL